MDLNRTRIVCSARVTDINKNTRRKTFTVNQDQEDQAVSLSPDEGLGITEQTFVRHAVYESTLESTKDSDSDTDFAQLPPPPQPMSLPLRPNNLPPCPPGSSSGCSSSVTNSVEHLDIPIQNSRLASLMENNMSQSKRDCAQSLLEGLVIKRNELYRVFNSRAQSNQSIDADDIFENSVLELPSKARMREMEVQTCRTKRDKLLDEIKSIHLRKQMLKNDVSVKKLNSEITKMEKKLKECEKRKVEGINKINATKKAKKSLQKVALSNVADNDLNAQLYRNFLRVSENYLCSDAALCASLNSNGKCKASTSAPATTVASENAVSGGAVSSVPEAMDVDC